MEETVCDIEVLACDLNVLAGANGERLVKGDALVPPASRTRSSRTTNSASLIPRDDSWCTWFSAGLPSSEERGTSLDAVNAKVTDVAVSVAAVYKEEEIDERVGMIVVGVPAIATRFGLLSEMPPHGSPASRQRPADYCSPP